MSGDKKILAVSKDGESFSITPNGMWHGVTPDGTTIRVPEDVIRNCSLFKVTYEKPSQLWRAGYCDEYVVIQASPASTKSYVERNDSFDDEVYEVGNYFHPKNDAEEIACVQRQIQNIFRKSKRRRICRMRKQKIANANG